MHRKHKRYRVSVCNSVDARHFFPGARVVKERKEHPHHYRVTFTVENTVLDRRGYVADIETLGEDLRRVLGMFQGKLLNAHPLLRGFSPSIENLARCICSQLRMREKTTAKAFEVAVAEEDDSSAAYREENI